MRGLPVRDTARQAVPAPGHLRGGALNPGVPRTRTGSPWGMTARPAGPFAPPYYAVVFTSVRSGAPGDASGQDDGDGYEATAEAMIALAQQQPGYLGLDSARGADGLGITVSYWRDAESVAAWREHADHAAARRRGRAAWYDSYVTHVAKVERSYGFDVP